MGFINNVQNALNTQLNTVSGLPTVAWPNVEFIPTNALSYVRPSWLPANSELLLVNGYDQHQGIYQIDIFTQIKKGTSTLLLIADAIRDNFLAVKTISSGGQDVHIQQISVSPARRDEGWWTCYVQINYLAYN